MINGLKPFPKCLMILLSLGLMLGLLLGIPVLAGEKDEILIENKRDETIVLKMKEILGGNSAETIRDVYSGQTIRLDPDKIEGEVCAYRAGDLELPEKLGCRTLTAGDHWVID